MQAQAPDRPQAASVEVTDLGQVLPLPDEGGRGLTAPDWVQAIVHNRKATAGVIILLLFAAVAIFAPLMTKPSAMPTAVMFGRSALRAA